MFIVCILSTLCWRTVHMYTVSCLLVSGELHKLSHLLLKISFHLGLFCILLSLSLFKWDSLTTVDLTILHPDFLSMFTPTASSPHCHHWIFIGLFIALRNHFEIVAHLRQPGEDKCSGQRLGQSHFVRTSCPPFSWHVSYIHHIKEKYRGDSS